MSEKMGNQSQKIYMLFLSLFVKLNRFIHLRLHYTLQSMPKQEPPSCLFLTANAIVIALYCAIVGSVLTHLQMFPDTPEEFVVLCLAPPALILSSFVLILSFCPHGPIV